ncbi:MAG: aminodeoxychorismate lyase [Rhodanobacteraceae bacterium]
MTRRIQVNGELTDTLSVLDRGLAYGDGLFETMRAANGCIPLWDRHMQRLQEGCRRLGLPMPDTELLAGECHRLVPEPEQAVVRLTLTRGLGPRGYAAPATVKPTRIVQVTPAPTWRRDWYHQGVRVHLCRMRLAAQPQLAGIKHLNRLEQVLARNEWQDDSIAEGLVCDADGHVISATAANLFAVLGGVLSTPSVDVCGVAGVARAELLARHDDVVVRPVALQELQQAEEIFLTSSVRGILPVAEVPAWQRAYRAGPRCLALQAEWQEAGFMPAAGA